MILIACTNNRAEIRLGITAGKTVGNAVLRNRAKRRLREATRQIAPQLPTGWDVVLVARPGLPRAAWPEVTGALAQLLKRAKLVKEG